MHDLPAVIDVSTPALAALAPLRAGDLASAARIAPQEIAYLRAIVQGVEATAAASRFLDVSQRSAIVAAHRDILARARSIAQRIGEPRGALLPARAFAPRQVARSAVPDVQAWADEQGLSEWSWDEIRAMHAEAFGIAPDASHADVPSPGTRRAERLLHQRLEALNALQDASPVPHAGEPLAAWLAPRLAQPLAREGINTLGELAAHIERGGRWWSALPAFGPLKAQRLAGHIAQLVGASVIDTGAGAWTSSAHALSLLDDLEARISGANRGQRDESLCTARTDRQALAAWIAARSGSTATSRAYAGAAERFLLWLAVARHTDLAGASVDDCRAFRDFLGAVPASWCSRTKAAHLGSRWRPFRGPLSVSSQAASLAAANAWCGWLARVGYLRANPFDLVNRSLGDRAEQLDSPTTRAFTPLAWQALQRQLDDDDARGMPGAARLRWLVTFAEATGLRAHEILQARRGALQPVAGAARAARAGAPEEVPWQMSVVGKGRKARLVVVPPSAIQATRAYFAARGMDFDTAEASTRLLERVNATTQRALAPVRVAAGPGEPREAVAPEVLYRSVKRLIRRAAAALPAQAVAERQAMLRASTHWLRHTHATRATERGVGIADIQEQLGHADPRTAARYSRAQIVRRAQVITQAWRKG